MPNLDTRLTEYVPGRIWLKKYPVHYAGANFFARTTFVRLNDDSVLVHSPSPIDETLAAQLKGIGPVKHIVAPGSYHYFHVTSWQNAYPEATTWICPGVERKCPGLDFDWFLSDRAPMLIAAAVALVLLAFGLPLLVRTQDLPESEPVSPTQHLDDRAAALYENLRDLQGEYLMGKLSDEDYKSTKQDVQRELARVKAEIAAIEHGATGEATA